MAAGKASYKLKYYNIQDLQSAAAAPSHTSSAAGSQVTDAASKDEAEQGGELEAEVQAS